MDSKPEVANTVYQKDDWYQYRVLAKGEKIQVWVKGTQISDGKNYSLDAAKASFTELGPKNGRTIRNGANCKSTK